MFVSKRMGITVLLMSLVLIVVVACGSEDEAPAAAASEPVTEVATDAITAADGDVIAPDDGDAMAADDAAAMAAKVGDAMVAKDGDAMAAKVGDAMVAKDGDAMVAKDGDAMATKDGDAMATKDGDAMAAKDGDAMVAKDGDAMAAKDGDAMAAKDGDAMAAKDGDAMAAKADDTVAAKDGYPVSGDAMTDEVKTTLSLSFTGVDPLQNGYHYEGWAVVGGSVLSTGKFNIGEDGALVDLAGNVIWGGIFDVGTDLTGTSAIILTIEPEGDTDIVPASTHYLAGSVVGSLATLDLGHASSLKSDFLDASGSYILATPTDDPSGNENSGVWFLDLSSGSPAVGLELPTLPSGWNYEGWAVIDGVPVTTGTFRSASGVDDAAPYSGVGDGPPFPGEDFLNNAPGGLEFPTDLSGATAVISIEPSPDDSPLPFTLKPLVGGIPAGASDHSTYQLDNMAGNFPTGLASIR